MDKIKKYYSNLTEKQISQFAALQNLYAEWNEKINVISRKDVDNFYERHVLHSLAIASYFKFEDNTKIIDIGCGGGFPGIPLAIFFPNVKFHLIDAIGKKIKVVQAIAAELQINNVNAEHIRAEQINDQYNFTISRAVTDLSVLFQYSKKIISKTNNTSTLQNQVIANGMICLKGGDLSEEKKAVKLDCKEFSLHEIYEEEFFETKKLLYLPLNKM